MMIVTPSIIFNNKKYPIDESALATATAELKSHLSTVMNGSGSSIELDGVKYNVDSTKLSSARNEFISHLGAIAGNGLNITVNGVRYSIDSSKVASVISDLEVVFGNLNNPDADSEFVAGLYQTGAVALYKEQGADAIKDMLITPLDEFVSKGEVIIDNGVFCAGFVIPDNLPEKNEYGFYYDVPYGAGGLEIIYHEDGSCELWNEGECVMSFEAGSAVYSQNIIDMSNCGFGIMNVYVDGTAIGAERAEMSIGTPVSFTGDLILPNDGSITSLGDYSNFGKHEGLTGIVIPDGVTNIGFSIFTNTNLTDIYMPDSIVYIEHYAFEGTNLEDIVIPNSVTSIEHSAFKSCENLRSVTFENDSQLNKFGPGCFAFCSNLATITIPSGLTTMGDGVFRDCFALASISFDGTISQWDAINKEVDWNANVPATKVVCTDGEVAL